MNREEQEAYLYSRIGKPVNFTYPTGEGDMSGRLIDRVVVFGSEYGSIVYWNIVDLIRFEGEDEDWLRITYYRYNKKDKKYSKEEHIREQFSNIIQHIWWRLGRSNSRSTSICRNT